MTARPREVQRLGGEPDPVISYADTDAALLPAADDLDEHGRGPCVPDHVVQELRDDGHRQLVDVAHRGLGHVEVDAQVGSSGTSSSSRS
jgi:hypothetical protein